MIDSNRTGPALLQKWRKEIGRSQQNVADDADVTQPTVCEWEGGTRRPDILRAFVLEDISGGDVPVESWGYPAETVAQVRAVIERRAAALGSNPTALPVAVGE